MPRYGHAVICHCMLPHTIGIFRTFKAARAYGDRINLAIRDCHGSLPWIVVKLPWAEGVSRIRRTVYDRDGGKCVACGQPLTFQAAEMHERIPRGHGGDVTLENCEMRCRLHHTGSVASPHGSRRPQFTAKEKL